MIKKVTSCFIPLWIFSTSLVAQSTQLVIRGFSEGFYRPSTGKMVAVIDSVNLPLICDTVIIGLIDSATHQSVFCAYSLITTDGYGSCTIPSFLNGHYFFVSIKFRNTFHLLSANTIKLNGLPLAVDLTNTQNTCCNFDTTNGVVKAYSGDLNDDGTIDVTDFLIMDNDFQQNATGYLITDLTGNQVVDSFDFTLFNNNLNANRNDDFVGTCNPLLIDIVEPELFPVIVYPNPCKDYFIVSLDQKYGNIRCTLYDALGNICLNTIFEDTANLRINSSQLHSGIYAIWISTENKRTIQGRVIVTGN